MKLSILFLSIMLVLSSACTAERGSLPRKIVILIPHTVSVEPSLQREYDSLDQEVRNNAEGEEYAPSPDDSQAMRSTKENMMAAEKRKSLRNFIAHMSQNFFLYVLSDEGYQANGGIMIHMEFDSSGGDIASLRTAAAKYDCRFLVNFPELRLYRDGTGPRGTVHAQLYDAQSDAIAVDSLFDDSSDESVLGGCEAGTLECAILRCGSPFMMMSMEHIIPAFMPEGMGMMNMKDE